MIGAFAGPVLSELTGLPPALNAACAVTLLSALLTLWLVPRGDRFLQDTEGRISGGR